MHSPGQIDRVLRLAQDHRRVNPKVGLMDAIAWAEQELAEEDRLCRSLQARRVSGRTLNDTQVDLLCKGDMSGLARYERIREIEAQHAGRGK